MFEDENNLWSNLELKIRARNLNLTLVTFWILLAVKCPLENYLKPYGDEAAIPPAWGLIIRKIKTKAVDVRLKLMKFWTLLAANSKATQSDLRISSDSVGII